MKHTIMIQYSITALIYYHIDMYRRSLLCACAVYASDLNLAIEESTNLKLKRQVFLYHIHLIKKHFNLAIFICNNIIYHILTIYQN